jgi:hypothetical protein
VPVRSGGGALAGAIGLATGGWSGPAEEERLVDAVYDAARRATALLRWHPERQPSRRLSA